MKEETEHTHEHVHEHAKKHESEIKETQQEQKKESEAKETIKPAKDYTWQIVSGILGLLLIISIFTAGFGVSKAMNGNSQLATALTAEEAKQKAADYLNQNLLAPGTTATVKSIEESNNVYSMKLDVGGREFDSYMTKDGRFFFPTAFDTTKELPKADDSNNAAPETVPKTDKPKVDMYVMSFCPYGNRGEDTMYPVYQLLKDKADFNIHYIVSVDGTNVRSLHGQPESDQDMREACVKRDYGNDKLWKFMSYVNKNCGSNGACWKDAAKDAGVDADKLQACVTKDGLNLMKAEEEASNAAGAQGSPTLVINGVQSSAVYKYGQTEVYKQAICAAFNNPPAECGTALSENAAATTASGSCG